MTQKVDRQYWERIWQSGGLPREVEPERDTLRNHSYHDFHLLFSKYLERQHGKRLIEFGCAQSIWLCYFARHFGLDITGIDYSPLGCKKASVLLARSGIDGRIVEGDFANPPEGLLGTYDFGISFGVAEHFENTAECVATFARYLKPGGLLITQIPNLAGSIGWLQKHLDLKTYNAHVPLDKHALAQAHTDAGLNVVDCRYVVCSNFGVLTLGEGAYPFRWLRRSIRTMMTIFSAATWVIDRYLARIPVSRSISPYIACVARLP